MGKRVKPGSPLVAVAYKRAPLPVKTTLHRSRSASPARGPASLAHKSASLRVRAALLRDQSTSHGAPCILLRVEPWLPSVPSVLLALELRPVADRVADGRVRAVIRPLSRLYPSKWGAPVLDRVDPAIFHRTYFMRCMECTYCNDSCCAYGADIDAPNVERVNAVAAELEEFVDIPRERWFTGEWNDDKEFPGARQTRTRVEDGACVFRGRGTRGCQIHAFAAKRGTDYHELKPMVCILFPCTFDGGLLHPSNEILDKTLQCIDDGPTLYKGVRDEIAWYFGQDLVAELDGFERDALAENRVAT